MFLYVYAFALVLILIISSTVHTLVISKYLRKQSSSCHPTQLYDITPPTDVLITEPVDGRNNAAYNDYIDGTDKIVDGLKFFRQYALKGLELFQNNDLDGAIESLITAKSYNTSQPLMQLGIFLYISGNYYDASIQLLSDIKLIEKSKIIKASDLRLWLSACYNKLGKEHEAYTALDHTYLSYIPETKYFMNCTLKFFAKEMSIEDILDLLGNLDDKDFGGIRFFTNFYLGLYYDSIGDVEMAQSLLSLSANSDKYPVKDVWYHLPRILCKKRGY